MIGYLRGALIKRTTPPDVIVDVNGVGYLVTLPVSSFAALPHDGGDVALHIHTHVREDAINLYGFLTEGEKRAFMTLLGITGIGPKGALSMVSSIPYEQLHRAIENEDVALLTSVPGIGKKTAQRIILELKGKLPTDGVPAADAAYTDAVSALVNLGYKKADASAAIEKARKAGAADLETMLRESLKYLTVE